MSPAETGNRKILEDEVQCEESGTIAKWGQQFCMGCGQKIMVSSRGRVRLHFHVRHRE